MSDATLPTPQPADDAEQWQQVQQTQQQVQQVPPAAAAPAGLPSFLSNLLRRGTAAPPARVHDSVGSVAVGSVPTCFTVRANASTDSLPVALQANGMPHRVRHVQQQAPFGQQMQAAMQTPWNMDQPAVVGPSLLRMEVASNVSIFASSMYVCCAQLFRGC